MLEGSTDLFSPITASNWFVMKDIATQWYRCTWTAKTSGERTSLSEAGLRSSMPNINPWSASHRNVLNIKFQPQNIPQNMKNSHSMVPNMYPPWFLGVSNIFGWDYLPYHPNPQWITMSPVNRHRSPARRLRWLCSSGAAFEDPPTWPHRQKNLSTTGWVKINFVNLCNVTICTQYFVQYVHNMNDTYTYNMYVIWHDFNVSVIHSKSNEIYQNLSIFKDGDIPSTSVGLDGADHHTGCRSKGGLKVWAWCFMM